MQSPFGIIQPSAIFIILGLTIAPKIAISQTQWQVIEPNGIDCYENVPVDGENDAIATTFLEGDAIAFSDIEENSDNRTWRQVRLDDENSCWIEGNSDEMTLLEMASLPEPDARGNYPSNSPNHPRWEVTNRGLSGLNCYQTHPPNQGSHIVASRFFNGDILMVAEPETDADVFVESNDRTWMAFKDPWSGQNCWVRAHEDFIKPIE